MLPLPPRQNAWAVRADDSAAVARVEGRARYRHPSSVGEVASDVFGAEGQIAKASSDPARNDFGSKRLGDRIQARACSAPIESGGFSWGQRWESLSALIRFWE